MHWYYYVGIIIAVGSFLAFWLYAALGDYPRKDDSRKSEPGK